MAVPAQAQTPSSATLYSFSKATGGPPVGQLVEDSSGDIFGMTNGCNESGCSTGAIYELKPQGGGNYSTTILAKFVADQGDIYGYQLLEGASAGLAMDSSGNLYGATSDGFVFELKDNSGTYDSSVTILTYPNGPDSLFIQGDPTGALVYHNGYLYGTTEAGGSHLYGSIYKFDISTGVPTTIYSFAEGNPPTTPVYPNGNNPQGGLTLYKDSQGHYILFGTTTAGGSGGNRGYGYGTIFEYDLNTSTFTTLATFDNTDGSFPVAALYVDGNGDLFGTAQTGGGSNDDGTIFELPTANTQTGYAASPTALYSFQGNGDGVLPQGSVVLDGNGNLYGTAGLGGYSTSSVCNYSGEPTLVGCGTVYELPYNGSAYASQLTILHKFEGTDLTNDGEYPAFNVLLDSSDDLIGTTMQGGDNTGCGALFNLGITTPTGASGNDGCGTVFKVALTPPPALTVNSAKLQIVEGTISTLPGFQLQSDVTYGTSPDNLVTFDPSSDSVTLTVTGTDHSYTFDIPAGSFTPLTNGHYAGSWVYTGVVDGATLSVQIDPEIIRDGDKKSESSDTEGEYEFKANAFSATTVFDSTLTSADVTITFSSSTAGTSTGSITVTPTY